MALHPEQSSTFPSPLDQVRRSAADFVNQTEEIAQVHVLQINGNGSPVYSRKRQPASPAYLLRGWRKRRGRIARLLYCLLRSLLRRRIIGTRWLIISSKEPARR